MAFMPGFTHANRGTTYYLLQNDVPAAIATWSLYPATQTINASGNPITNISSLQLDDQVLTALSGELLLNGVAIATIPDISNVEDWALYPALANVNISGFNIQNVLGISGQSGDFSQSLRVNGIPVVVSPATTDINLSGNAITNAASIQVGNRTITTAAGTAAAPYLLLNGCNVLSNWSSFTAGTAVSMAMKDINNAKDITAFGTITTTAVSTNNLTLCGEVITTDGVFVYVDGNNGVKEYATFPAVANLNMSGFAVSNTPSVSISGNTQNVVLTASGTSLLVDGQPIVSGVSGDTSIWAQFPAVANVNMSGFAISNTPTISISGNTQNVVLTASGTSLFVDGQPVFTGALPPADTSNWAQYPANASVNMNGFGIGSASTDLSLSSGGSLYLKSASNIQVETKMDTKSIDMVGVVSQTFAGAGSNFFQSQVQIGTNGILPTDKFGALDVYGVNLPVGFSSLFVTGGVVLDGGGTIHGITIGTQPVAGINTMRIDVLPIGVDVFSATFITLNAGGAGNFFAGGALDYTAGSYITLQHGAGLGANGIFVQNFAADNNTRMIFTHGGTLYNLTTLQTSNIINPNGIQFWNGVYNPSGGGVPIAPAAFGRAVVDISSAGSYLANLTTGALPATKNSNSVFVGNLPLLTTTGATSTIAIGDISSMTGQLANSIAIGTAAGQLNLGSNSLALGHNANVNGGSFSNTIVLNATGVALNASQADSLYISPMRNISDAGFQFLARNSSTGEVIQTLIAALSGEDVSNWANYPAVAPITSGAGNSLAVNASGSVVLQHGTGSASNGIFLRNTAGVGGVKLVFTGAGTLYNADEVQTSDVLTPNGVRFYNGVYDPSGNPPPAIPAEYGRAVVDFTTKSAYLAYLTTGSIPAANRNTNSVFVGNFPHLTTTAAPSTIAIGDMSGMTGQLTGAIAIGFNSGLSGQRSNSIAIGTDSGGVSQLADAVAVGFSSGYLNQASNCIAIGNSAGFENQSADALAIGAFAGYSNQNFRAVAIGAGAGADTQGMDSVAIGSGSANVFQGQDSVAIGRASGQSNMGIASVAIGVSSAYSFQGTECVAVGAGSAATDQQSYAVALGGRSGNETQGVGACALGYSSGFSLQGSNSVAIGYEAGKLDLGVNSIAIGDQASSTGGSFSNTIVLNATGAALNPSQANSCYVAPMRPVQPSNAYQNGLMTYNATTAEVGYASSAYSLEVVATSATAISLDPITQGRTYILTGTTTQTFTTAALGVNDSNFFVNVKNGNANNGGDITISGATGNLTIHETKPTQNGGNVYLVWNGTGLVAY